MPNMSLVKKPMSEQPPNIRNKNFTEVALGYSPEEAIEEAARCIQCKHKPCISECPVSVHIPEFIAEVAKGNFQKAYDIVKETNALPAVCGRVCPQETQCESKCVRGIKGEPVGIGRLERFVADWAMEHGEEKKDTITAKNIKVAVIGSGPSGLTCAGDLAKLGYKVTVFEALHKPGGVLVYGVPNFRLPEEIVKKEVGNLEDLGVEIKLNMVIGRSLSIDDLFEMDYKAVYIASGAGLPAFMNIPGESLVGVYSANEFLTRVNLMKTYNESYDTPIKESKSIAIIGGGNVAMDAARCAKRLGIENVYIVYRRSEAELPARAEEIHHAKEEGIIFKILTNPIAILGDETGFVTGMECLEMELGEPDESGRRRPIAKEGSNFILDVDCVVISIGTSPNPLIKNTTDGLATNNRGCIVVDDNMKTSIDGIYAGGDAVSGAATVINAMGAGKAAASAIDEYLSNKNK